MSLPVPPRLLLVFRSHLLADTLSAYLRSEAGWDVRSHAGNPSEAPLVIRQERPDLVLIRTDLPPHEVLGLLDELRVRQLHGRPALIGQHFPDATLEQALRRDAQGFFLETQSADDVEYGLKQLLQDNFYAAPPVRQRLQPVEGTNVFQVARQSEIARFNARQYQVLIELALGYPVKEISDRLSMTEKSVEGYKYRLMRQLDIHDRLALALYAIREGLISPNDEFRIDRIRNLGDDDLGENETDQDGHASE